MQFVTSNLISFTGQLDGKNVLMQFLEWQIRYILSIFAASGDAINLNH